MNKIKVKQIPEKEIPTEILASAIIEISQATKVLKQSRLNDRAIIVLLKDATGLPGSKIKQVLDGIVELEKIYIKAK